MKYLACISITWVLGLSTALAQSSKTIRTYGISHKKEVVTIYENDLEIARYVEEIERYNEEGDWIEKRIYDEGGELKSHRKRIYDKGEVVEEIEIDPNGSRIKEAKPPSYDRRQFVYDKGDLVKELILTGEGETLGTIEYSYNKFGDLIEETEKSAEGHVVRKEITEYDDRGLKSMERVFDGDNQLVSEKRFIYE